MSIISQATRGGNGENGADLAVIESYVSAWKYLVFSCYFWPSWMKKTLWFVTILWAYDCGLLDLYERSHLNSWIILCLWYDSDASRPINFGGGRPVDTSQLMTMRNIRAAASIYRQEPQDVFIVEGILVLKTSASGLHDISASRRHDDDASFAGSSEIWRAWPEPG